MIQVKINETSEVLKLTSFLLKIIALPLIIGLASYILPNVHFTNFWQPVILGVVLAIIGTLMEGILLRTNTVTLSTVLDFIVATIVLYFGATFFTDAAYITFAGAVITALIIGIAEHFTHRYLMRRDTENTAYN